MKSRDCNILQEFLEELRSIKELLHQVLEHPSPRLEIR